MKNSWLMGAYISVIGACNYNCIYCSASKQIANNDILSYEDFLKIFEIFQEKKLCKLSITGGEPFLHKDIEKIIETSVHNFSVTVLTNGSLLESHSEFLCNLPNKNRLRFSVSLDASTPEKNEKTRGANTFQRTLKGIELLVKLGYNVNVLCTLTSFFDIGELEQLAKLAHGYGAKQLQLTPLQPSGQGKQIFDDFRPSNHLLTNLLQVIPEVSSNSHINIGVGFGKCYDDSFDERKNYNLLPCKAGITQISVASNGDVYTCNALNIYMGNILKQSIDLIMNDSEGAKRIQYITCQTIKEHSLCNKCDYNKMCTGGCRGIGHGYFDDVLAPDIYCDRIHLN